MKNSLFVISILFTLVSCNKKDAVQQPICEEKDCIEEELKVEARRHIRW